MTPWKNLVRGIWKKPNHNSEICGCSGRFVCVWSDHIIGSSWIEKETISIVLGLFASKTVTLEKAAELTGKSVWDFMDLLQQLGITWGEYTEEELSFDERSFNRLLGEDYE